MCGYKRYRVGRSSVHCGDLGLSHSRLSPFADGKLRGIHGDRLRIHADFEYRTAVSTPPAVPVFGRMRRPGSGQSIVRSVRFGARLRSAVRMTDGEPSGFAVGFLSVPLLCPPRSRAKSVAFPRTMGNHPPRENFRRNDLFVTSDFPLTCNCAATGDRRGATTRRK